MAGTPDLSLLQAQIRRLRLLAAASLLASLGAVAFVVFETRRPRRELRLETSDGRRACVLTPESLTFVEAAKEKPRIYLGADPAPRLDMAHEWAGKGPRAGTAVSAHLGLDESGEARLELDDLFGEVRESGATGIALREHDRERSAEIVLRAKSSRPSLSLSSGSGPDHDQAETIISSDSLSMSKPAKGKGQILLSFDAGGSPSVRLFDVSGAQK